MPYFVREWGNQKTEEFVARYCQLPLIPTKQVILVRMATININHKERTFREKLFLKDFITYLDEHKEINMTFPSHWHPQEQISPIVVYLRENGEEKLYRVLPIFWTLLVDVIYGISLKHNKHHQKILPKSIHIDDVGLWIIELSKIVGYDFLKQLKKVE